MTTPEAYPALSATAAARQHQEEADLRTIDVAARVTHAALVALGCDDGTARTVGAAVLAAVGSCEARNADVPGAAARFADALARWGEKVPAFDSRGNLMKG